MLIGVIIYYAVVTLIAIGLLGYCISKRLKNKAKDDEELDDAKDY